MTSLHETLYMYYWNRMGRKGQFCHVLVRGGRNSCLVEFMDGYKAVTSRNALRRVKEVGNGRRDV